MPLKCTTPKQTSEETGVSWLFREGYTAKQIGADTVILYGPGGSSYLIDILFETCSCQQSPAKGNNSPCRHLLGYEDLLSEQEAYDQALLAALEAQHDEWEMTLESDRTERLLREGGVCVF